MSRFQRSKSKSFNLFFSFARCIENFQTEKFRVRKRGGSSTVIFGCVRKLKKAREKRRERISDEVDKEERMQHINEAELNS